MAKVCVDCGSRKKTNRGIRCHPCSMAHRNKERGRQIRESQGIIDPPWFCVGCGEVEVSMPQGSCHHCAMEKRRKYPKHNFCLDCGIEITARAERCPSCAAVEVSSRPDTIKRKSDPVVRKNVSNALARAHADPSKRKAYSEAMRRRWERGDFDDLHTDEWRKNHARKLGDAWQNGVFDGRARVTNPSGLALAVFAALIKRGHQATVEYFVEKRFFDIYVLGLDLLVEVDGEYWHYSDDAIKAGQPRRDQEKQDIALSNGYNFARLREGDLKDQGIESAIEEMVSRCAWLVPDFEYASDFPEYGS